VKLEVKEEPEDEVAAPSSEKKKKEKKSQGGEDVEMKQEGLSNFYFVFNLVINN
jgi:hypothetical protein